MTAADRIPDIIDAHCHGVRGDDLSDDEFAGYCTESPHAAPPGSSYLDSPLGLAIRRWCAPVLDLPAHTPIAQYLERRRTLGAGEVNRRLLRSAALSAVLVDTGFGGVLSPGELGAAAASAAFEIVRIETLAEAVAGELPADVFVAAVRARLRDAGENVVGFKSILAYRHGFDVEPAPPDDDEVTEHVRRWQQASPSGLAVGDPVILRFLIWAALTAPAHPSGRARPLQFHVGYGDTDLDLHRSNPLLLTELIRRAHRADAAPIVLLHCYPYHREAAYLAAVYPNVYFDVGLISSHAGASVRTIVAEALEIAPFGKLHYSSDGCFLAELFHVSACGFVAALRATLKSWTGDGALAAHEAEPIVEQILSGTARRLYPGLDSGAPARQHERITA